MVPETDFNPSLRDSIEFPRLAQAVQDTLLNIASDFCKSPAAYLYECEIQGEWLAMLRRELGRDGQLRVRSREYSELIADGSFAAVRAEYPSSTRFDLALIGGPLSMDRPLWMQHPRIGIEIKLWNFDGTGGGIDGDVEKLRGFARSFGGRAFSGLSCLFVQPGLPIEKWLGAERLSRVASGHQFLSENDTRAYYIGREDDGQVGIKEIELRQSHSVIGYLQKSGGEHGG